MWKKIDATQINGTLVTGDSRAPATRWWNRWWLALRGWKTAVILGVPEKAVMKGYQVGYKPAEGPARLKDEVQYDYEFAVRIGREDCTFFVVDIDGQEISVASVKRSTVKDVKSLEYTLH